MSLGRWRFILGPRHATMGVSLLRRGCQCPSPAAPFSPPLLSLPPHCRPTSLWALIRPAPDHAERAKPAAKSIAVVTTVYCYLSHAYHIAGRFLDGYLKGGEHHFPDFGIASVYVDQFPENDLSRDLAKEHGFRLSRTIEDALTLGTGKLAVDGVLLICEHGDYPYNAKGQKLYPRHEFFQQDRRGLREIRPRPCRSSATST